MIEVTGGTMGAKDARALAASCIDTIRRAMAESRNLRLRAALAASDADKAESLKAAMIAHDKAHTCLAVMFELSVRGLASRVEVEDALSAVRTLPYEAPVDSLA